MSLKVGDVVELKSGSHTMTVNRWLDDSTSVEVCWYDYNECVVKLQTLNHNALTLSQ